MADKIEGPSCWKEDSGAFQAWLRDTGEHPTVEVVLDREPPVCNTSKLPDGRFDVNDYLSPENTGVPLEESLGAFSSRIDYQELKQQGL